jgi:molecular chaperone GrpE (heat shock protein)
VNEQEVKDTELRINKLEYRIRILTRNFDEYEKRTNQEIDKLKAQKSRDDYRITILLRTIDELENKLKEKNNK